MLHASSYFCLGVDLVIFSVTRFSTECSQKLFCMVYGSKKDFDNFVMLHINGKVAMLLQSDMKEKMF